MVVMGSAQGLRLETNPWCPNPAAGLFPPGVLCGGALHLLLG